MYQNRPGDMQEKLLKLKTGFRRIFKARMIFQLLFENGKIKS